MELRLAPGLVMVPTGSGALHAVTSPDDGLSERLLRVLLHRSDPVTTDDTTIGARIGLEDPGFLPDVVADTQRAGWIEGRTTPLAVPEGPLGRELPGLLAPLSDEGRAALVDDQGFSLASVGFDSDADREITVLAAEVARLQQRRTTEAVTTSDVHGWGLLDHRGVPDTALYPFTIGEQKFILIVGGLPRLVQDSFTILVSSLSRRYGVVEEFDVGRTDLGPADPRPADDPDSIRTNQ